MTCEATVSSRALLLPNLLARAGLLTTNPFGVSTFEGGGPSGEPVLPAGDSLRIRYRIYIHEGDATEGKVAEKYASYASPPTVYVE